jgi:hypothetical protein
MLPELLVSKKDQVKQLQQYVGIKGTPNATASSSNSLGKIA